MWSIKSGDEIEFWSGENGGCWKPGVVLEWWGYRNQFGKAVMVRIRVGNSVTIVRPLSKCRKRGDPRIFK